MTQAGERSSGAWTRRAALAAALGAGGLLAAACGGAGPDGGGGSAARPALRSGITLQAIVFVGADPARIYQDVAAQFPSRDPRGAGIKVDLTSLAGNAYWDKLLSQLAAGDPPDAFWVNGQNFGRFAPKGHLLDLGPLVKRDKVDLKDFWPASVEVYSYKGSPYALTDRYDDRALFVNMTQFHKAGVPLPPADYKDASWTWDRFLDAAQRITRASAGAPAGDGAQAGQVWGAYVPTGYIHTTPWVWSAGGELLNKDRTECLMTQAGTVDAFQFLADLMHRHKVAPAPADLAAQNEIQLFQAGRLGMVQLYAGQIADARRSSGFDWDVAPLPRGKAGIVMQASGPAWSLPAGGKNREEAWALMTFMTSPAAQQQIASGGAQLAGRKSVAEAIYRDMPPPPRNARVFTDGLAFARPDPFTANWADVEKVMAEEQAQLWQGKRAARETMGAIKARVDALLKEGAR